MDVKSESPVYSAFAEIYDRVMRDVDYDSWIEHIFHLIQKCKIHGKKILDLACGTGNFTLRLAAKGYQVVGIDQSEAMLQCARAKLKTVHRDIPLYRGFMQSFSALGLERDFDWVICLYDSLNYILQESEVERCFAEVHQHLRPGGGFIFDVTTEYNLLHNFSGYTFAENFEDASYIWENEYRLASKLCISKVTIFTQVNGQYFRSEESHNQRVYSSAQLTRMLENQGFAVLGTFHNLTDKPVQNQCERIHFVCQKPEPA